MSSDNLEIFLGTRYKQLGAIECPCKSSLSTQIALRRGSQSSHALQWCGLQRRVTGLETREAIEGVDVELSWLRYIDIPGVQVAGDWDG